ncbi:MAG: threonylcarbamoyl-AMP synthase [Verrucomicrobia bacterium]|nr:threonylcarbamoyl-AMP synthase [Verrucomicrobiota bacterium]
MILNTSDENLQSCAERLRRNELVAVPTETVYGLAGNALSESAVRKIFEIKGRPFLDPLIVHCRHYQATLDYIEDNEAFQKLAQKFWPGPLTLIAQKKAAIPDLVTAGLPSVAIRVPAQPVFQNLLKLCNLPLAAPSANPFGYVSPTEAAHVAHTLGKDLPVILDGGRCKHGVESTIIDVRNPDKPILLRYGPIALETIQENLQAPLAIQLNGSTDKNAQTAPGMLSKHYSPRARVHLLENGSNPDKEFYCGKKTAFVYLHKAKIEALDSQTFWLTEDGKLETAAHNLFALLQSLDAENYTDIVVELAEDRDVGLAINDRLKRAAAR